MDDAMKPWMTVALIIGGFLLFMYAMSFVGQAIPG